MNTALQRAFEMGDEGHNRHVALVSLLSSRLAVGMLGAGVKSADIARTLELMCGTDFPENLVTIGLALAMATAKSMTDPCIGVEYSSLVVAMSRNGVDFGIRISGLGDEFFSCPANKPFASKLFEPFTQEDVGLDMGDSAITETVGWGGFILPTAPGYTQLFCQGVLFDQLLKWTSDMRKITTTSGNYKIPALDGEGNPLGIDLLKVIETGIVPVIDTGVCHREINKPVVGRGMVYAPMACFQEAYQKFIAKYGSPLKARATE